MIAAADILLIAAIALFLVASALESKPTWLVGLLLFAIGVGLVVTR